MKTNNETALGIIDVQRGFIPAQEGERLGLPGFGELPVENGERVVRPLNQVIAEFALRNYPIFTTQDWHPIDTAHFAQNPDYKTTWPVHCVGGTAGAELHPSLVLPQYAGRFRKGFERLQRGEDDTSYSGYNALLVENDKLNRNKRLDQYLKGAEVGEVVLGGLALDYCVKHTALDLRTRAGLDVILLTNATEAVAQETAVQAIEEMEAAGVQMVTSDEYLRYVRTVML